MQNEQAAGVKLALDLVNLLVTAKKQGSVLGIEVVQKLVGAARRFCDRLALILVRKDLLCRQGGMLLDRGGWGLALPRDLYFYLVYGGMAEEVKEPTHVFQLHRAVWPRRMVRGEFLAEVCRQIARSS